MTTDRRDPEPDLIEGSEAELVLEAMLELQHVRGRLSRVTVRDVAAVLGAVRGHVDRMRLLDLPTPKGPVVGWRYAAALRALHNAGLTWEEQPDGVRKAIADAAAFEETLGSNRASEVRVKRFPGDEGVLVRPAPAGGNGPNAVAPGGATVEQLVDALRRSAVSGPGATWDAGTAASMIEAWLQRRQP